jgi:hypothetical protein
MKRLMPVMIASCAMALLMGGQADAQIRSQVIDTNALVVKPVETTTTIVGRTLNFFSRVTADMIDNSQIIRTVNNLFGTNQPGAPVQSGISPLPHPSSYPSGYYRSPIQPVMPRYQTLPNRR